MGSLMVAPIISGAMAAHVGWRNFWWLNVALIGLSFLMVLFMFPETKWHRIHPDEVDQTSLASSNKEDVQTSEKTPIDTSLQHVDTDPSQNTENGLETTETAARDPWLGRGGPSKQQWAIFQPNAHPWKSIALDLWIPWKLFAFPIVEFASFVVSWSCSSFLTINLTQTQAFAAPPYNMSSQSIGKCSMDAGLMHQC
jgi:MFS family permease